MTHPIIVYGPPACGKTTNGERLAKHFGLSGVIDEWVPGDKVHENHLHLTSTLPWPYQTMGAIVLYFWTAMDLAESGGSA